MGSVQAKKVKQNDTLKDTLIELAKLQISLEKKGGP